MARAERDDLAAMFATLTRRLVDAEAPILAANGLSMWEYVVLTQLVRGPAPNQRSLAEAIRHDKTRLIPLLDRLQQRKLIDRRPGDADRRSHAVELTSRGRTLQATVRAAIRDMEDEFLASLDRDARRALLATLPRLVAADD